ncbi:MAG: phage late control D family protein [Planctomycetes bacterium]|nr:phage late control D family protein [Planctomycetota bacterium]
MSTAQEFRRSATCKITVSGKEITDLCPYLVDVKVETSRSAASVCTMTFDTIRLNDCTWLVQDADIFEPWNKFKIKADFGDYDEEIMRGFVKTIQADTPEQMGEAKVIVTCQDETMLLDREHTRKIRSREDEPKTDGKIAREIAGENELSVEAEDGLSNITLNQDSTNIQLLRDRAEANGYEFYIRKGELHIKPPQLDEDPQPSIMVYAGAKTNCLRFSVTHDGHRPDKVGIMRAAETGTVMEKETLKSDLTLLGKKAATSENAGLVPFVWQTQRPAGSSLEEAKSRARAKANKNAWKVKANGELDGSLYGHVLLTHKLVGVYGVGETYSGLYYVDSVSHIFDQNGYRQSFKLLRNATGQNTKPESEGLLAALS